MNSGMQELLKKASETFSPGGTMATTTGGGGGHSDAHYDITEIWKGRVYGKL